MEFRFNGTGDSAQVPRFGCDCRACTRARVFTSHQRGPCCAELSVDGRRYLLDAGRMDLAHSCELERPAAFFVTHYHADHVQGLFHLRWGGSYVVATPCVPFARFHTLGFQCTCPLRAQRRELGARGPRVCAVHRLCSRT